MIFATAIKWAIRTLCVLCPLLIFYLAFLNYLEPSEVGIARNQISGKMWLQKDHGWFFTSPWTSVARIDTRPMRVAMTTAGRGYSAKLVQFVPNEWQEFVSVEGFHYYWWYNRNSYNGGYREEYRGLRDIFRGHAYGAKQYAFLKILSEFESP